MAMGLENLRTHVFAHLAQLTGHRVLIVGDVGVDEYVMGQVRRISPEAPVPIVEVATEELRLGLSANVAQNVVGLGGAPILVSVVGRDSAADQLIHLLRSQKIATEALIHDASRPTTRKTRVMVQNHHIVRVDYEQKRYLNAEVENQVLETVRQQVANCSIVILQDYAKGVVSERLAQEVIRIARKAGRKILVDPNRHTPIHYYRGADLMTPNFDESLALSGVVLDELRPRADVVSEVGRHLMKSIDSHQMVITRGKDGMAVFEREQVTSLPTFARQVADVTGAGDTVIAAVALGLAAGFTLEQACTLGNLAAGVVVAKIGCVPCSQAEILEFAEKI